MHRVRCRESKVRGAPHVTGTRGPDFLVRDRNSRTRFPGPAVRNYRLGVAIIRLGRLHMMPELITKRTWTITHDTGVDNETL